MNTICVSPLCANHEVTTMHAWLCHNGGPCPDDGCDASSDPDRFDAMEAATFDPNPLDAVRRKVNNMFALWGDIAPGSLFMCRAWERDEDGLRPHYGYRVERMPVLSPGEQREFVSNLREVFPLAVFVWYYPEPYEGTNLDEYNF